MKIINQDEFLEILKQNKKYIQSNGTKGSRAFFGNSLLYNIDFETANLKYAHFHYGMLLGCNFSRANFTRTWFYGTQIQKCDLRKNADIQANFLSAKFDSVTFIDCGHNLKFTNAEFNNVNILSDRVFFNEQRNICSKINGYSHKWNGYYQQTKL